MNRPKYKTLLRRSETEVAQLSDQLRCYKNELAYIKDILSAEGQREFANLDQTVKYKPPYVRLSPLVYECVKAAIQATGRREGDECSFYGHTVFMTWKGVPIERT